MTVFANGLEISAKAQGCKVIAAFPDACFTPPQTPPTPTGVPVPYPDFGQDSDLTKGSGKVKIGGEEISQENSSKYSKCTGDEAGAAPKKGLVTSNKTGPIYAQKWSMDVKVEGKGVARFSDIATTNHACNPPNPAPNVLAGQPGGGNATDADCLVGSWKDIHTKCNERKDADGNAHEAHHIIPDRVYRTESSGQPEQRINGCPSYNDGMNICLPRSKHRGSKKKHPDAAHANLDKALEALGQLNNTAANPANVEQIKKIRKVCIAALAKLVPKTISANCFKKAAQEVVKQTAGIADKFGRSKKGQLSQGSAGQNLLQSQ
ncbi:PAAR-like domain-containing protein [Amaricoccus solimangrovi]|uniref:PAAR-like domain-containing protein n=1 Tax=Amaricoccus solimangrovi TaxID=2589815 RepID=UPI0015E312C7|nr:PAAR-like domain-containing protein [Amaricoccus solimangrovi]